MGMPGVLSVHIWSRFARTDCLQFSVFAAITNCPRAPHLCKNTPLPGSRIFVLPSTPGRNLLRAGACFALRFVFLLPGSQSCSFKLGTATCVEPHAV